MGWIDPRLDWNSTHFYNFEDLNRVEVNTSVIAELLNYFVPVPNMVFITDRDMRNITFAENLSRIENNQILLRQRYLPAGWLHRPSTSTEVEKFPRLIQGAAADVQLDDTDLHINRNLLLDSNFYKDFGGWETPNAPSTLVEDIITLIANGTNVGATRFELATNIAVAGEYTISVRVKSTARLQFRGFVNLDTISGPYFGGDLEWLIISHTFKTIDVALISRIRLYLENAINGKTASMDWAKIEKGPVATPWQPAPEDSVVWYQPTKVVNLEPIDLSSLDQYEYSVFKWDAVTPTGTKVNVEYSLDKVTWKEVKNDQGLSFANGDWMVGKTLYIRQTLSTTDQAVTPTLKNFTYTLNGYQKEVKWSPNDPFSFRDAFRLENNMNLLYKHYKGNTEIVPICGAYICGEAVI